MREQKLRILFMEKEQREKSPRLSERRGIVAQPPAVRARRWIRTLWEACLVRRSLPLVLNDYVQNAAKLLGIDKVIPERLRLLGAPRLIKNEAESETRGCTL